jgi:hypothetical protein
MEGKVSPMNSAAADSDAQVGRALSAHFGPDGAHDLRHDFQQLAGALVRSGRHGGSGQSLSTSNCSEFLV